MALSFPCIASSCSVYANCHVLIISTQALSSCSALACITANIQSGAAACALTLHDCQALHLRLSIQTYSLCLRAAYLAQLKYDSVILELITTGAVIAFVFRAFLGYKRLNERCCSRFCSHTGSYTSSANFANVSDSLVVAVS